MEWLRKWVSAVSVRTRGRQVVALWALRQLDPVWKLQWSLDQVAGIGILLRQYAIPFSHQALLFTEQGRLVLDRFGGMMDEGTYGAVSGARPSMFE